MVKAPGDKPDIVAITEQIKAEMAAEEQAVTARTLSKLRDSWRWAVIDKDAALKAGNHDEWRHVEEPIFMTTLEPRESLEVSNWLVDKIKLEKLKPAFRLDAAFQSPTAPLHTMLVGKNQLVLTQTQMNALGIPTEEITAAQRARK